MSCQYHRFVTGDLEKAAEACKQWAHTYHRDSRPRYHLSALDRETGQFERSLLEAIEAVQVEPYRGVNYLNLFNAYLALNRLEEARVTVEQAQVKKLDSAPLHLGLSALAFLQNNAADIADQVVWGIGKPGVEDEIIDFEADSAAYAGQLVKAHAFSQRVIASYAAQVEVSRPTYSQPETWMKRVTVQAGHTSEVDFAISEK